MKDRYTAIWVVLIGVLLFSSFSDPLHRKKITDVNFRYEFFTTAEKVNPREGRIYHWFKAGAVHNSENGTSGELLHGEYEKFYLDNQMAEKGKFHLGQRDGTWKTWHRNGMLDTKQYWQDGRKQGTFLSYDTNGVLVEKGNFRKGKKYGKWINYVRKDTVVYKKDQLFVKKIRKTKEERKTAREEQKKIKEQLKIQNQEKKKAKAAEKKNKKQQREEKALEKKNRVANDTIREGFFKRLFSKKEKP